MAGTTARPNGSGAVAVERRLPEGVSGLLLVGKLRHVAASSRNEKQLLMDVESVAPDGHVRIDSVSGWMLENDGGGLTPLGKLFAGGHLARLVDEWVCLSVSARAAATKSGASIYWSVEAVTPFGDGFDTVAP